MMIDLKKKYPGYFNVWVFRGALIIILVIFATILYMEDFNLSNSNNIYIECPGEKSCINPLYECRTNPYTKIPCKTFSSYDIPQELYKIQYIEAGTYLGRPPQYTYVPYLFFGVILAAFGINHILYKIRRNNNGN